MIVRVPCAMSLRRSPVASSLKGWPMVTVVEAAKRDALFSYKGFKSYQPLNTWWAEQQMVLHTEFQDGNVPAGYEQLRIKLHIDSDSVCE